MNHKPKLDFLKQVGFDQHSMTQLEASHAVNELRSLKWALDQSTIVAITDLRGRITHVNEKFCEISGYTRGELLGQTHSLINSGTHPPSFFKQMWKVISSGQVWKGEICNRNKMGALYWVDTTIVPLDSEDERQYIAIRSDITERKRVQQELDTRREKNQMAEKMASLGEFAAGVCHELGNPVAAIRGRAELLAMKVREAQDLAEAQTTVESYSKTLILLADRMYGIMRSMKALGRDGSRDPFAIVSIISILETTLEFGQDRFKEEGIVIRIDTHGGEKMEVECRETELIQILVNLLNNACDAIKGHREKWIRIVVEENTDTVTVRIIDSGPALPETVKEKLFDNFYSTKNVHEGSGMGLHISRNLAEANSASLHFDPDAENTTFVLKLLKRQTEGSPRSK